LKLMTLLAFALGPDNVPLFFLLSGLMGLLGVYTGSLREGSVVYSHKDGEINRRREDRRAVAIQLLRSSQGDTPYHMESKKKSWIASSAFGHPRN